MANDKNFIVKNGIQVGTTFVANDSVLGALSGASLTNLTAGNLSGTIPAGVLGNSKLSVHAATTSAELATIISDETGSGALVFATGPTLSAPIISGNTAFDTNTLFIDSANDKVGIGTTTPASKLTVTGNAEISTTLSVGANASITGNLTVNTITSGTWNGSLVAGTYGGTGVNNGAKTITIGGNVSTANSFTTSGNFGLTLTQTAATSVTLPTTGTLATLDGTETFTAKTLTAPIINGNTAFSTNTIFVDSLNTKVGIGLTSPIGKLHVKGNGLLNNSMLYVESTGVAAGNTSPFYGIYANIVPNNAAASGYGAYITLDTPQGAPQYGLFASANQSSSTVDSIGIIGRTQVNSASTNHGPNRALGTGPVAGVYALAETYNTAYTTQTTALYALNNSAYGNVSYGAWIETIAGPTTVIPFKVVHAGTELLQIASSGNLGVGNTNPVSKLTVTGNAEISTTLSVGGDVTITGNLTVNGTTTTINSTTISVDDKNIELGSIGSPTNVTADGGGITLKGASDKTFNWVNATGSWTSSEDLNLLTGKVFEINGVTVLSSTALGTGVTGSSLTSVGTIGTGVWQATAVAGAYGGTGVINTGRTITLGGNISTGNNFTTSGNFAITLTANAATTLSLPNSGTVVSLDASNNFTANTITANLTGTASSANNSGFLGGTVATGYQTTAGLSANVATLTSNNATYFGGNYTWASPAAIGGTTANTGQFTTLTLTSNTATIGTAAYHVANGNVGIGTSSPSYKLSVSGDTYLTGNVGIGVTPSATVSLYLSKTFTSDSSGLFGVYSTITDANTTITAARSKSNYNSVLINTNQNKSADGLTAYNSLYTSVTGTVYNGLPSTGGDARADSMFGVTGLIINTANGANANTINNTYGVLGQVYQNGSGTITTAYGLTAQVVAGNNSVTGAITNAYGGYSLIQSNTAMTIGTGYLYYGAHQGSTTTTKYGMYLLNETTNYFSGNTGIGNTAPTHKLSVNGTSFFGGAITFANNNTITANGSVGSAGQVLTSNTTGVYWSSPVGVTNLGQTSNGSTVTVTSSTGTNTTITAATASVAGLMTSEAQTIAGTKTFNSNVVFSTATAITANASVGSAGQVLTSNATGVYWSTIVSATNLSLASNGSTVSVNSDTGTDVIITAATGSLAGILTAETQTIGGIKTFSSTISGSINGNAATVTNGVYTTGDQTIGGIKTFANTTASTTYTTGAVIVSGGLGVAGAINAGGDVTAYATSDSRLKTNIENITDALSKVCKLDGVTYNWNDLAHEIENKDTNIREVGVLAGQINEVLPEVVTVRESGYMAVRYEKIVPLLIEAIKELQAKVDKLEKRV
jgi:hypothetical protein